MFCRQMEVLFKDNVRNTWRPRALARMTAALQRKQEEIAALGPAPAKLTLQHVGDTVIGRVDLEALCTSIRTEVRSSQPGSVCCRLRRHHQGCTSVAPGTTMPAMQANSGSACQQALSPPCAAFTVSVCTALGNLLHPQCLMQAAAIAAAPDSE